MKSLDAIFEFCNECEEVTPFVGTFKCLFCGCDSPFGNFYDDEITQNELDDYIRTNTKSIKITPMNDYKHITTEVNYIKLLKTGMFF